MYECSDVFPEGPLASLRGTFRQAARGIAGGMASVAPVVMMVLLTLVLFVNRAGAEDGIGIGVIVGEPTGISAKKWLSYNHAVDAGAGWSFADKGNFQFHADYLIHNFEFLDPGSVGGRLPVYFGVGGRLKLKVHDEGQNHDDALLGVRLPLGIAYHFPKEPVELFAEIVPVLDVVPATKTDLNAAIGARFYFK